MNNLTKKTDDQTLLHTPRTIKPYFTLQGRAMVCSVTKDIEKGRTVKKKIGSRRNSP